MLMEVNGRLFSLCLIARIQLIGGGIVSAGSGSIAINGSDMRVTQTTDRLAIDWQSFSIGTDNSVAFAQPSASSIALNRVLGSDVSTIQGALRANGQVFLLNPNGVLFSPTAQVEVGGLVASTLNLGNGDSSPGATALQATAPQASSTGALSARLKAAPWRSSPRASSTTAASTPAPPGARRTAHGARRTAHGGGRAGVGHPRQPAACLGECALPVLRERASGVGRIV